MRVWIILMLVPLPFNIFRYGFEKNEGSFVLGEPQPLASAGLPRHGLEFGKRTFKRAAAEAVIDEVPYKKTPFPAKGPCAYKTVFFLAASVFDRQVIQINANVFQPDVPHIRAVEFRFFKIRVAEVTIAKFNSAKSGTAEIAAAEVQPAQIGSHQVKFVKNFTHAWFFFTTPLTLFEFFYHISYFFQFVHSMQFFLSPLSLIKRAPYKAQYIILNFSALYI
jgi:hypothetical protein